MNILPRRSCQRFVSGLPGSFFVGAVMAGSGLSALAQGTAAPSPAIAVPAPAVPAWQHELEAIRLLQTAAALSPPRDAAAAQQQRDAMMKLSVDLATKYPTEVAVQQAAASFCGENGRPDLAVQYWERAQTLDPHDAVAAEALGSAALARGDVRTACNQFQRAVNAQPGEAEYHFDLANVLYLFRHDLANPPGPAGSDAEMVDSLEQFRLASALAPTDARFAQSYAETFYMLTKPDWSGAQAAWEKVRLLNAPHCDFANENLARVSLRLEHPDEADKYLDAIHDPRFGELKAKLHAQADKLRQKQAPAPPR